MVAMTIISAIIIFGYVYLYFMYANEIPETLSASAYKLPSKSIWVVAFFSSAFLAIPQYIQVTSDNTTFLAFLSMVCYMLVGATPLGKEKMSEKIHMVCAIVCGILSQVVILTNKPLVLLVWLPFVVWCIITTLQGKKSLKTLFWAEMVCLFSTYVYCLIG